MMAADKKQQQPATDAHQPASQPICRICFYFISLFFPFIPLSDNHTCLFWIFFPSENLATCSEFPTSTKPPPSILHIFSQIMIHCRVLYIDVQSDCLLIVHAIGSTVLEENPDPSALSKRHALDPNSMLSVTRLPIRFTAATASSPPKSQR